MKLESRWILYIGWGFLLGGFSMIIFDLIVSPEYVAKFAIHQSANLPETLTADKARDALQKVGEMWLNHHKSVLLPVLLMLAGGVVLGISGKCSNCSHSHDK